MAANCSRLRPALWAVVLVAVVPQSRAPAARRTSLRGLRTRARRPGRSWDDPRRARVARTRSLRTGTWRRVHAVGRRAMSAARRLMRPVEETAQQITALVTQTQHGAWVKTADVVAILRADREEVREE